ncbi:MAG: endonuclease/exonuclease/phosphatase family protein [Bacteroidales bacterium]|nr:endonuclease/exonuclease/phosphatase family protein [Lentimicrobiaceae bacterium]MDD5693722.1 endonuclease/exonuclease/phosphatase family protein [Bacteroidales bacterium]
MESVTKSLLRFIILFLIFIPGLAVDSFSQEDKQYRLGCIAFYNLENLFDTINDPSTNDEEFLPDGRNAWDGKRYADKLKQLSSVIERIGIDLNPDGPAVIGVSEIENRAVLEDLAQTESLKNRDYQVVHFNSPDRRGVDVGLLYQPKYFQLLHATSHRLVIPDQPDYRTRDQLVVSGIFDGDTLYLIVCHWPSRSSGEKVTLPYRIAAAGLSRTIVDSILGFSPDARIILMGDLNDNPVNKSVVRVLGSTPDKELAVGNFLYNPMTSLYRKGIGSTAWRDTWSLFDQMIVSPSLVHGDPNSYRFYTVRIFNERFLTQSEGEYKGYPYRTFGSGVYLGGYSDHFPVYLFLYKEDR